ncbi:MAG TPA: DsbA family protein [Gammaproteobacteria bacterium]
MKLTIPLDSRDHIQGSLEAPAVLIKYGDYQCPHCATAYPIIKSLQKRFAADLCFAFRNMPFARIHPQAQLAAEAAEAAGAQNQFWPMHDALYENQSMLGPEVIHRLAGKLGLDIPQFEKDLAMHRFRERIRGDFMGGVRSGVNGTPTFFINGERYNGHTEERALSAALLWVINNN